MIRALQGYCEYQVRRLWEGPLYTVKQPLDINNQLSLSCSNISFPLSWYSRSSRMWLHLTFPSLGNSFTDPLHFSTSLPVSEKGPAHVLTRSSAQEALLPNLCQPKSSPSSNPPPLWGLPWENSHQMESPLPRGPHSIGLYLISPVSIVVAVA